LALAKKRFASFLHAKPRERSANVLTKIVRKKLSSSSITAARKRRLAKLAARPDSTIDFSDIPELTEKFWRSAVRNPFYRPIKQQLTLRLDADVIAWLRKQGKGYQTRANALLRAASSAISSKKPAKSETSPPVCPEPNAKGHCLFPVAYRAS
jgi:uncharacterized protein (DUF4415 family)